MATFNLRTSKGVLVLGIHDDFLEFPPEKTELVKTFLVLRRAFHHFLHEVELLGYHLGFQIVPRRNMEIASMFDGNSFDILSCFGDLQVMGEESFLLSEVLGKLGYEPKFLAAIRGCPQTDLIWRDATICLQRFSRCALVWMLKNHI